MLPHDLSPWGMFLAADLVVKSVMVGLAFASVVTWTVALAKALELLGASRALHRAKLALTPARSLADASAALNRRDTASAFLDVTLAEVQLSEGAHENLSERVQLCLERLQATASRRMGRGLGLLATIGATAPFVGLFGTVWGIMNSFIGISQSQTTNLAVVAPGIAEALLATALGLVAAIPAVVVYNMLTRALGGYRARLADITADLLRILSRDLARGGSAFHQVADIGSRRETDIPIAVFPVQHEEKPRVSVPQSCGTGV